MDADQDDLRNPFGMDESCPNCPDLVDARERVVHGYGDVAADFVVVGEVPSADAEAAGVPFTGDERGRAVQSILGELGFSDSPPDAAEPALDNVYLTTMARCRHGDRSPTDEEVATCEPFLNAEVRTINPDVIVTVGERTLREVAAEYSSHRPGDLSVDELHATPVRGRGFELLPMRDPADWVDGDREAFVEAMRAILARDYRQTKGPRR